MIENVFKKYAKNELGYVSEDGRAALEALRSDVFRTFPEIEEKYANVQFSVVDEIAEEWHVSTPANTSNVYVETRCVGEYAGHPVYLYLKRGWTGSRDETRTVLQLLAPDLAKHIRQVNTSKPTKISSVPLVERLRQWRNPLFDEE